MNHAQTPLHSPPHSPLHRSPSHSPPHPSPSLEHMPAHQDHDHDALLDQRQCVAVDIDRLEACAVLPKQRDAIAFIHTLQNASLNDPSAKLSEEALFQLAIDEAAIQHGISTYFALKHSAVAAYEHIRKSGAQCFRNAAADVPSYARIK